MTQREGAATGAFLAGSLAVLLPCAAVALPVMAGTVSMGLLLLIPASVVGSVLRGTAAAQETWRQAAEKPVAKLFVLASGGWAAGTLFFLLYLAAMAQYGFDGAGGGLLSYFFCASVWVITPGVICCSAAFFGGLVAEPFAALMRGEPAINPPFPSWGYITGAFSALLPFAVAAFICSVAGSGQDRIGWEAALSPFGRTLLRFGEEGVFFAVFLLAEALLLLIVARLRANRQKTAAPPAAYLRLLLTLAGTMAGVLLVTLWSASRH